MHRLEHRRAAGGCARLAQGSRARSAKCATGRAITRQATSRSSRSSSDSDPVWPWVTSTRDNCLGPDCPSFDRCHVVKARRNAQDADIVVVNHHLLMADLALKEEGFGDLLPGADAIVLDEAHQLPEIAANFLGFAFPAASCNRWRATCRGVARDRRAPRRVGDVRADPRSPSVRPAGCAARSARARRGARVVCARRRMDRSSCRGC